MDWFDGLLKPIMVVVAWIMVQFHSLFERSVSTPQAVPPGRCRSSASSSSSGSC